jgi:hypothetical protein
MHDRESEVLRKFQVAVLPRHVDPCHHGTARPGVMYGGDGDDLQI